MLHGILFSPLQGSPIYRLSALEWLSCSFIPVLQPDHNLFQNEYSTRMRYNASPFNFQYPPFSLRSSSNRLRLLPRLSGTLALPCIFPFITCCSRQFLSKMWPVQLAFFLLYVGYSSPPCLCAILLHFSHDRSNWSSTSFCTATIFYSFPGISDLLSEVSRHVTGQRVVKYRRTLCPDCRIYSQHIVCTEQWDTAVTVWDRTLTEALNCKQATNFVLNKMTSKSLTTSATKNIWRPSVVFAFLVRRTTCEGGEWTFHRNVGKFLLNCKASQPKMQNSSGTTGVLYLSVSTSTGGRC